MMKSRQRKGESLNEYIARFSIECLTVTKPENSIILLAFKSVLNDERSDSKRFKGDDGWINIHNIDDVRERAERFTASENFQHIAAGLRGERHEKRNHSNNNNNHNNIESHPGRPQNDQDRRNRAKGPDSGRNHRDEARRPTLRTFAQFTPLNAPRAKIFHLPQNSRLWERPSPSRSSVDSMNQFCDFHGSPGHSTESCKTLKNNLEDLI